MLSMNIKTFITLIFCFINSFAVAMDHQPAAEQMRRGSRRSALADVHSPRTVEQEVDQYMGDCLHKGEEIRRKFPKLFAIGTIEELYPGNATITQQLQIAMVRNDYGVVQSCLALMQNDQSFTPKVLAQLQDGIAQAEGAKKFCRTYSGTLGLGTAADRLHAIRYLDGVISFLSLGEMDATKELGLLTGPCAVRLSLTVLCGSPEDMEQQDRISRIFKGTLVVGLCQLLLPAHQERARSFTDAQEAQKYLDDVSKINSAVWAAYKKKPNEFETLLRLKQDIVQFQSTLIKVNTDLVVKSTPIQDQDK